MTIGLGQRALVGIGVIVVAAVGTLLFGGTRETTIVMLVAGTAAVLIAFGLGDPSVEKGAPAAEPREQDPTAPPVATVIDAICEPVLIVEGMRVTMANEAAETLLGRHVVGQDVRTAIRHPAAAERLASASDDAAPIELDGLGRRGQRWQLRVTAGGAGRRIVHILDQTGSYQSERARTDFVANASHELRTPLAAILGFVETLQDPDAGADEATRSRFLGVMQGEARRMQRLVDDLISLSRIEADKHRTPDAPLDLGELAEEVVEELNGAASPRAADLVVDRQPDLPPIAGDRAQLSQLLHNLIGNAMNYGRAGTPVTVSLATGPRRTVLLKVADQGEGIAAEHLPRLTERFYRIDAGRSRAGGGTGLGLAIVKHIVERHRGQLDIASKSGVGTTVLVRLPAALSSKRH